MSQTTPRLLLISGPVGVGKTTVANELSTQLEARGIAHSFVDLDALTYTFPRDPADPYGDALALENLTCVWENARRRGARNLIVPRVVETAAYAARVGQAVGIADPVLCRLTARDDTLLTRVKQRELGSGLAWHEKRSLFLSDSLARAALEDFCVATDGRSVSAVATEVMQAVDWIT